jgi:hypothetical protein
VVPVKLTHPKNTMLSATKKIADSREGALPSQTSIGEEVPQDFLADLTLKESANPVLVLLVDDEIPSALRKCGLGSTGWHLKLLLKIFKKML